MILKISTGKVTTKRQVDDECSFLALVNAVAEDTKIPEAEIDILIGFPPKQLIPSDVNELIRNLGIVSGTTLTVRSNPDKRQVVQTLREMGFIEPTIVATIHGLSRLSLEDAIEKCSEATANSVASTAIASDHADSNTRLAVWSIPSDNSCLFNAIDFTIQGNAQLKGPRYYRQLVADVIASDPVLYNADFLEKQPGDYISWILNPDKWGGEIELSILSNALQVEIAVVDISSTVALVYGNGAGFLTRIYLLYDGSHYDAVVRVVSDSCCSPPNKSSNNSHVGNTHANSGDVVVNRQCITEYNFPTTSAAVAVAAAVAIEEGEGKNHNHSSQSNESSAIEAKDTVLEAVKAIAALRRQQRKFVNLQSGALLCKQCNTVMQGQKEAVEHAKSTGHTNFGEL